MDEPERQGSDDAASLDLSRSLGNRTLHVREAPPSYS